MFHRSCNLTLFLSAFTLLQLFTLLPISVAAENNLNQQRQLFLQAKQTLANNDRSGFFQLSESLKSYPLYPYLQYEYLNRRLNSIRPHLVSEFLAANDDLPVTDNLRRKWLRQLAKTQQWHQLIKDYTPQTDAELSCLYLTARLTVGQDMGLLDDIQQQWLVGKSLPDTCDPAFDVLYRSDVFNDELIWQRIRLAMYNRQPRLAKYLSKKFQTERYRKLFQTWSAVYQHPGKIASLTLSDKAPEREILTHGLQRLAKTNLNQALSLHEKYKQQYDFSDQQKSKLRLALARAALNQQHPSFDRLFSQLSGAEVDRSLMATMLAVALEKRDWGKLLTWFADEPPAEEAIRNPWLYWRARAQLERGQNEAARITYTSLADSRDYYGFLAADYLQQNYGFNHQPLLVDEPTFAELQAMPAVARIKEFLAIDDLLAARREWQFLIGRLEDDQLRHAAILAHQWQWHDRVIITMGKGQLYDDLKLRFPLGFDKSINWYSQQNQLDKAWLYALIRTESGFFEAARSPAGALGLMQVMPATGKATAKRLGWKQFSSNMLLDAERNIPIGSAYLKNVLRRFDNNMILATAAYNAGPNRVKQWLPQAGCMEADIWIEQIPFRETRSYVKRILYYASIYDWRLNNDIVPVSQRMRDVFSQSQAGLNGRCERGLVMKPKPQINNASKI